MDVVKANEYDAIRLYEHFRSKKSDYHVGTSPQR